MSDEVAPDWPENLWSDYPRAAVRLTTIEYGGVIHLLFGYVELIPEEIPPPYDYRVQPLNAFNGGRLQASLSVLPSRDAVQWYESAQLHQLSVPKISPSIAVQNARLEPEPRIGRFVVAAAPPVTARWHAGPRMHRMVPMEELPAPVAEVLGQPEHSERRARIRTWLTRHVFIDLTARPDCAGGLVLLAPNPVVRGCSEYPLRFLDDGSEVLGVKAVPRAGRTLATLSVWLREVRSDGQSAVKAIPLDAFGKGEIILPQRAGETALEIHCAERGLLSVAAPHGFIRSIQLTGRVVNTITRVEVPNRRKGLSSTRHDISTTVSGFESHIGESGETDAASRLVVLLAARTERPQEGDGETLIIDDRAGVVTFVRRLVGGAARRVLFVDPYFSSADVREFALSVSFQRCAIGILTGREEPRWRDPLSHVDPPQQHGLVMSADLDHINRIRSRTGSVTLDAKVMGGRARSYHDRFLVVDDQVWHFGHSFNALGCGTVAMATRLARPESVLQMILDDFAIAMKFEDYWGELAGAQEHMDESSHATNRPPPPTGIDSVA